MSVLEHRFGSQRSAITGFVELTLRARDPAALLAFYIQGFGLAELSRADDRIWLAAGESARLGICELGSEQPSGEGCAHVRFAFGVAPGALAAIAQRLRAQGVDVEGPVEHDGGDCSLCARDPDGNVVEAWDLFDRGRSVLRLQDSAA